MKIIIKSPVPLPPEQVWEGFNLELLKKLTPGIVQLKADVFEGTQPGCRFEMRVGAFGVLQEWKGLVTQAGQTPGSYWFVDEGVKLPWPLKTWKHLHAVRKSANGSVIYDLIQFSCRPKWLNPLIFCFLFPLFSVRKRKYLESF